MWGVCEGCDGWGGVRRMGKVWRDGGPPLERQGDIWPTRRKREPKCSVAHPKGSRATRRMVGRVQAELPETRKEEAAAGAALAELEMSRRNFMLLVVPSVVKAIRLVRTNRCRSILNFDVDIGRWKRRVHLAICYIFLFRSSTFGLGHLIDNVTTFALHNHYKSNKLQRFWVTDGQTQSILGCRWSNSRDFGLQMVKLQRVWVADGQTQAFFGCRWLNSSHFGLQMVKLNCLEPEL